MCSYTLVKIKITTTTNPHCVYQNDKSLDPSAFRNSSYKWEKIGTSLLVRALPIISDWKHTGLLKQLHLYKGVLFRHGMGTVKLFLCLKEKDLKDVLQRRLGGSVG